MRTADKYAARPIDIEIIAWECQVTDPDVWHLAHAAVPVSEVLPCDILSDQGESLAQAAATAFAALIFGNVRSSV